ncbi:hypothetical protein EDD85DRAFT_1028836 [Armillaria nabsnona]|nr:hypothetical protein EDD85DRAFT_1028836 [Armillaria nabsnona]
MLRTGEEDLKDLLGHESILDKNWRPDLDSHVIVAACGESEFAQEVQVAVREGAGCRGAFTKAVISTLRSVDQDVHLKRFPAAPNTLIATNVESTGVAASFLNVFSFGLPPPVVARQIAKIDPVEVKCLREPTTS